MKKDIRDYLPVHEGINMAIMDVDLNAYNTDIVSPIIERVAALEEAGTHANGHEIEIQIINFPVDAPVSDETRAICWRYKERPAEDPYPWSLLVYESELKGMQGDTGPEGPMGKGLAVHGTVNTQNALTLSGSYTDQGLEFPAVGTVMVVNGVDEAWVYKGPVDHHVTPPDEGWMFITNWNNLGKVAGIVGPKGPKGEKGATGSGIGAMIVSIMISSAISIATSSIMMEVNTAINDAINDAMMAAEGAMEDIAQSAIEKAIEEAGDQFKGDKGDKGDEGKAGKDGRSCQIVGTYSTLTQFRFEYPLVHENVGKAALIDSAEGTGKELWAITESHIGTVQVENFGDIRGPQGDPSEWTVSFRNADFTPKGQMVVVPSDMPEGVAGMYIRDSDSVIVTGASGSSESSRQVGFKMEMKYPIPNLHADDGFAHSSTVDKFLTNNGEVLEWVDIDVTTTPRDYLLLNTPSGKVGKLTIDDNFRISVVEVVV